MTNEEQKKVAEEIGELFYFIGLIEGIKFAPPDQHKIKVLENLEIRVLALEQRIRKNLKNFEIKPKFNIHYSQN